MKKRYLLILSLLVFLVQITLVQQIRVVGIVPNLILIMIVMSVLIFDDKEMLVILAMSNCVLLFLVLWLGNIFPIFRFGFCVLMNRALGRNQNG